jgi:hypothetical protein
VVLKFDVREMRYAYGDVDIQSACGHIQGAVDRNYQRLRSPPPVLPNMTSMRPDDIFGTPQQPGHNAPNHPIAIAHRAGYHFDLLMTVKHWVYVGTGRRTA